jgi:hypothetical protein
MHRCFRPSCAECLRNSPRALRTGFPPVSRDVDDDCCVGGVLVASFSVVSIPPVGMTAMTVAELRVRIMDAWMPAPYPGDAHIAADGGTDAAPVAAFFRGRHWRDVTAAALEAYPADPSRCLASMTAVAFQNYIASYMLIALDRVDAPTADNWTIGTSATYHLNPPPFGRFREERAASFAPDQAAAVVAFLALITRVCSDDYPMGEPQHAYLYWSQAGSPR